MKQTLAHKRYNEDLLKILPKCNKLIEVGCSYGSLCRAYKMQYPKSYYIGIEIQEEYSEVARKDCDLVLTGNISDLIFNPQHNNLLHADCWIFGDCIEHLFDPWTILREVKRRTSLEGSVCACIPNMQHWSIQLRLNSGEIDYQDDGLLDRTHLRWFTRKSIINLFSKAGFSKLEITPRIFPHQNMQKAMEIISLIAIQQNLDPSEAIADSQPTQYVIKAS